MIVAMRQVARLVTTITTCETGKARMMDISKEINDATDNDGDTISDCGCCQELLRNSNVKHKCWGHFVASLLCSRFEATTVFGALVSNRIKLSVRVYT